MTLNSQAKPRVYIDGSHYWDNGKYLTGCAVLAPEYPNAEAGQKPLFKLPSTMLPQEAELTALLQTIRAHPEPLCAFTDSIYVFGTVHDYMAQWQLRTFLTSAGSTTKQTITSIWQEIQMRQNPMSVVKVRAHIPRNPTIHEQNNNIVDQLAKEAAVSGTVLKSDVICIINPLNVS